MLAAHSWHVGVDDLHTAGEARVTRELMNANAWQTSTHGINRAYSKCKYTHTLWHAHYQLVAVGFFSSFVLSC